MRAIHWGIAALAASAALTGCKPPDPSAFKKKQPDTLVEAGVLDQVVVETGTIEAQKTVDVKSRVGGRIRQLLVDEGDVVSAGQLIAVVDPQEVELQVKQGDAQLRGAQASVRRSDIEISKRRITLQTSLARAKSRLAQLELELNASPKLTDANIRTAEATLATQQKNLETLTKVTHSNQLIQVENAVTDARNNLAIATNDEQRRKGLLEKGYVSEREYEQSKLQVQLYQTKVQEAESRAEKLKDEQRLERERADQAVTQARVELDRAKINRFSDASKREEYRQAVQNVRDAEADLKDIAALGAGRAQQQASVDQLSSSLADNRRQLRETEIRAPIAGVVAKRSVQVGELVTSLGSFSSGTSIVRLDDRSSLVVKLKVNEIDVAKLTLGHSAEVTVDALPDAKFSGKITKIAPAQVGAGTATAGTDSVVKYEVEIRLDSVDDKLKAGMSAKCSMKVIDLKNVVKVPVEYVGKDDQGSYVLVANSDPKGKPTRTAVTTGAKTGSHYEIKSGLKAGDKIVQPDYKIPDRKGMMQFGPDDEEDQGKAKQDSQKK